MNRCLERLFLRPRLSTAIGTNQSLSGMQRTRHYAPPPRRTPQPLKWGIALSPCVGGGRELRRWTRKSRRFLRSSTYLPLPFITAARINLVRRPAKRGGGRERERKELFAPFPSFPGPLTRFCRHQITIMCTEKAFRKIAPNHILLLVSKHSHILDSAELRSPRK